MNMLLSVIVPVYNAEKQLEKCVRSILSQLPQNAQLILVDDGSTDGSGALCDSFSGKDSRVIALHQPNAGASGARNKGLAAASGRFIQFVDADDSLAPGLWSAALPVLEQADIFFFGIRFLSGAGCEAFPDGCFERFTDLPLPLSHYVVDTGLFASPVNKIYRRELLEGLQFDVHLPINEDLLFNLQVLSRSKKSFFSSAAYYICDDRSSQSLSRQLRTDLLDAEEYTRCAFLSFLSHCGLSSNEAQRLLMLRQQQVAVSQCSILMSRKGSISLAACRRLFKRALAPAHQQKAICHWIESDYSSLAQAIYLPLMRWRCAGLLALLCKLRNLLFS